MREGFESIFNEFSNKEIKEAKELLLKRLQINKININIIKNKKILDVGCGPGRYTMALKLLGAREVVAVDIFKKNKFIPKSILYKKLQNLEKLPFQNNEFDFIFCNGSISHNKKWKSAIKEYKRVLKKDGWLWLSLFGKGKHWKYCDNIRKKLSRNDAEDFKKALLLRDWKPNKIFFLIDIFFIDRVYFTKTIINNFLKKINFIDIIHLKRGYYTDLNEKIYNNPRLKKIYGEGEIRLIARK